MITVGSFLYPRPSWLDSWTEIAPWSTVAKPAGVKTPMLVVVLPCQSIM
jgi:hypothetical protein